MRLTRWATVYAAVALVATAWPDTTVQLNVTSLEPQGPYTPGQQVSVSGKIAYADLPRPWGGGGRMTTQTRHGVSVALEIVRDLNDDWPEVPDMRSARGGLYFYDGGGFTEFSQDHGAASGIWSTSITPPARTERTDPMTHRDEIPFEGSFTVPQECVAVRLRAQLENTVGANWFVTHYRYDYHPLQLDVPGVRQITVTCSRKPFRTRTRTVVVSDQTDQVTITGQVTDPRWQPIHRATVTARSGASEAEALTGSDGRYSLRVSLVDDMAIMSKMAAGTLKAEEKTCDFRLDAPVDLISISYRVTAQGYRPRDGTINLRVPFDVKTIWVSGYIVHRDAESESLAAQGRITNYHRVPGGQIMLRGPKGANTFDFHWGDFTGYVPIRDDGDTELKTHRIILLDPDPNAQATTTAAEPGLDGFDKQLKVIWDQADENLRELWLRLGLLIAFKKDLEAVATAGYSGTPDNVQQFLARWRSGNPQKLMYNALWTLRESLLVMPDPALADAASMETHAQNAKKAYAQLKGETLQTTRPGAGPLQSLVQNIIDKEEAGLTWYR